MSKSNFLTVFHRSDSPNEISDFLREVPGELIDPTQKITIGDEEYVVVDQHDEIEHVGSYDPQNPHVINFEEDEQYVRHIFVKKI